MSQANIRIAVRNLTAHTSVLDIDGEINSFAENALMDAYTLATNQGARTVLLNFQELDYMNSTGIGLLVTLLIRIQRQKQRLAAYGLSDHYQQIFMLTRLNEAITIYPDEASALSALK